MSELSNYRVRLDIVWDRRDGKMDWLGLETFLREVLHDTHITAEEARATAREALAAYTRRG